MKLNGIHQAAASTASNINNLYGGKSHQNAFFDPHSKQSA